MKKINKNSKKELLEILNQHKALLKNIDNKSSILLAVCSILFASITSLVNYLKWYFLFIILFILVLIIILLIISIYPRDKNLNISKSNDILYFGSIIKHYKNKENNYSTNGIDDKNKEFFNKKISRESIIEQLIRICQIIGIKYILQKISIIILCLNFLLFIIFLFINFI